MSTQPEESNPKLAEQRLADELSAWAQLQAELATDMQRRQALSKSEACVERASRVLSGNERLAPVEQLEIYRQQFWLRHTSSLLEDYPGLSGILGQAAWEPLVETYLQAYPPSSWTLRDLGEHLAHHVAASSALPHHALCLDMARLEWAYTELFDAPVGRSLDPTRLAAISPEAWDDARLVFSPCLRLLRVDYPVARLRRRFRDASLRHTAETQPITLPGPEPQNLVLYRDARGSLRYSALSDTAAALLEALHLGQPLVRACETAETRVPGAMASIESQLGAWFSEWGAKGWIIDVVCDP